MIITLYILFSLGFVISGYAVYGFYCAQKDSSYKTICDLSDKASCTKAFSSTYGKHFGIPNGFYGMGFYLFMLTLLYLGEMQYLTWLAGLSVVASCYLAYLLATKVKAICLDCIGIYIINITSLVLLLI